MNKLDHIAINVSSITSSIDFYSQLGFSILYADETWALLRLNDINLALTLAAQHKPHFAISVDDERDLMYFYDKHDKDIKEHRDGSKYIYIDDPDGNTIEYIYWPKKDE